MSSVSQIKIIKLVSSAILECVGPQGAPNGPIYAALMGKITLDQYNSLVSGLKKAGALTESGHYFSRGPKYDSVLTILNS